MFDNFTYKQKFKGLIAIAILSFVVCYQFAISNTIAEYRNFTLYSGESNSPDQSTALGDLTIRWKKLNELVNQFVLDTLHADKNLLMVSGDYCKNSGLKLKEYRPYHFSREDSINVLTRVITVEGNFVDCIKLIYELETQKKVGRVNAAEFKSYKDPQDKKIKLNCSIYLQNLISNTHEK